MSRLADSAPVRFGLIGAGNIARRFAQGIAQVPGAAISHVWSRTPASTHKLAGELGIRACDSLEALLAADLDAVYVATLHDSHARYSIAALEAGKAVLCEKPACIDAAELDTVLATARRTHGLFMEAMKPPFFPLYRQLRDYLAAHPIGDLRLVRAGFAWPADPGHSVHDPAHAGGGLLDVGIYPVFLALDWLGPVLDVQCAGQTSARGVDTFATLQCRHERGIAQLYCGIDAAGLGDALLVGTQGRVIIDEKWWSPVRACIRHADGRETVLDAPYEGGGLNYETAHFCQLLRAGLTESPILTHDLSRGMIRVLDTARTALGVCHPLGQGPGLTEGMPTGMTSP